jgi:hypothetical protein
MPISDPWKSNGLPVPPVRAGVPIEVFRFNSPGSFTPLPNVVCLGAEEHEGIDPGSAAFRYVMDPRTGGPYAIEQALSTAYTGPLIVEVGDRLCVRATRPDGETRWIFDGFPMGWGGKVDARSEGVALQAVGVAVRAFAETIPGQSMRHADAPNTVADVQTDVVVRFNPGGKPNATPLGAEAGDAPFLYPTFLDPLRPKPSGSPLVQRIWTLVMAVKYLIFKHNDGEPFVRNPSAATLESVLISREPIAGVAIDPDDESTFTKADITAPDPPLTGERWPRAVRKLTEDYAIGMRWQLETPGFGGGDPRTTLRMFPAQAGPVKSIYLDQRGADFDAAKNNVGAGEFERDLSGVVNTVIAEGALIRHEASLVLQCLFPSSTADAASSAALQSFRTTDPAFATGDNFDKFRLYGFDETGEGHYAPGSTTKLTTVASLDALFGEDKYARRRRVPIGELFKTDTNGKPLRWRLAISTDYAGTAPAIWDGTGTWQHVEGGALLLKDRLGIRISIDDPNHWTIGKTDASGMPFPGGVVKGVKCQAAADAINPHFFLRLTCVVEADEASKYVASRQDSSPVAHEIDERLDVRDRLGTRMRAAFSEFNNTGSADTVRDDEDPLKAEAIAVRTSKEAGVFGAEVMIPYFTDYYEVGDRIDRIEGRDLNLRTDGGGAGVAPVYPTVISRRWDFSAGQRTFLTLSDRGSDHRQHRRRGTRSTQYAAPPARTAGSTKGRYTMRAGDSKPATGDQGRSMA